MTLGCHWALINGSTQQQYEKHRPRRRFGCAEHWGCTAGSVAAPRSGRGWGWALTFAARSRVLCLPAQRETAAVSTGTASAGIRCDPGHWARVVAVPLWEAGTGHAWGWAGSHSRLCVSPWAGGICPACLPSSVLQASGSSKSRSVLVQERCPCSSQAELSLQVFFIGCSFSELWDIRAHAHPHRQADACRSCPYQLARWCYFSLIWFLSNSPEVEISQQNQCIQSRSWWEGFPFIFALILPLKSMFLSWNEKVSNSQADGNKPTMLTHEEKPSRCVFWPAATLLDVILLKEANWLDCST